MAVDNFNIMDTGAHEEAQDLLAKDAFISAEDIRSEDDPFRDVTARDDAIVW
jgi:hypothetical protein